MEGKVVVVGNVKWAEWWLEWNWKFSNIFHKRRKISKWEKCQKLEEKGEEKEHCVVVGMDTEQHSNERAAEMHAGWMVCAVSGSYAI